MKFKLILILAISGLLAAGCSTTSSSSSSSEAKSAEEQKQDEQWENQREVNPEVGMTKEQISGMYGKADSVTTSSDGESWSYHVNRGEAFIPFNFGYRPKFRMVTFDKDGVVTHWAFTE